MKSTQQVTKNRLSILYILVGCILILSLFHQPVNAISLQEIKNQPINYNITNYYGNGSAVNGTTDHGALTGLSDDDHTRYVISDNSRGIQYVNSSIEFNSTVYPVLSGVRRTVGTSDTYATSSFKTVSSGDMIDGFGPIMVFQIQDNAGTSNPIGYIGAKRAGADTSGDIIFGTYAAGASTDTLKVLKTGDMYLTGSASGVSTKGLFIFNTDTAAGVQHASRFMTQQQGSGIGRTLFYAASPSATSTSSGQFDIVTENGGSFMSSSKFTNGIGGTLALYGQGADGQTTLIHSNGTSYFYKSNVVLGATSGNQNALLQIDSTTKSFLPPRMTTTQRNAITSPVEGMQIYDLTNHTISFYNGSAWKNVAWTD